MVTDGGDDPISRSTAFCELALVLSSGLDDENGMVTLFKVCYLVIDEQLDVSK